MNLAIQLIPVVAGVVFTAVVSFGIGVLLLRLLYAYSERIERKLRGETYCPKCACADCQTRRFPPQAPPSALVKAPPVTRPPVSEPLTRPVR